jgi:hypothetical protein
MRMTVLLAALAALILGGCRVQLPIEGGTIEDQKDSAHDAEIAAFPWPDHVTAEEKNKIEEALKTIWDVGGRDARDAEKYLVRLDKDADATEFRMVGRIVTEMKNTIDEYGVDEYEGKSRIRVLDRILRKIDGVQERLMGEEYHLDLDEPGTRAIRLTKTWNWWYRRGRFVARYKPWDPRVDMADPVDEETE